MEKASSDNGVDRLSPLPDYILCHILSFLDTKYAVATSVLSIRWKNLCKKVPNIILDSNSPTRKKRNTIMSEFDFASFGLRQIRSLNVPYINKFCLKCDFTTSLTQTLVCEAISRDVKELEICLQSFTSDRVILPPEIFTSRSLVVMKLRCWNFYLRIHQLVCLPNLKALHLQDVRFPGDHDSLRRLFEGCKLLEDLTLTKCRTLEPVDVVDLSVPSLRKLAIKYMYGATELVIDAPNLEFFEYEGCQVEFRLVNELKSIRSARICFTTFMRECESVHKLINKMHGIKFLYLSQSAVQSMGLSSSLLVLKDLTHLELCVSSVQELLSILRNTPQLQQLVISLRVNLNIEDGRVGVAGASGSLPNVVSACFAKHLKSIVFKRFCARENEFELANYLLENGKVLKMMKFELAVRQLGGDDLSATFNSIAKFPKSSEKCEIVFVPGRVKK